MNSEKAAISKLRPAMTDFMIFVAKNGEQVIIMFGIQIR